MKLKRNKKSLKEIKNFFSKKVISSQSRPIFRLVTPKFTFGSKLKMQSIFNFFDSFWYSLHSTVQKSACHQVKIENVVQFQLLRFICIHYIQKIKRDLATKSKLKMQSNFNSSDSFCIHYIQKFIRVLATKVHGVFICIWYTVS